MSQNILIVEDEIKISQLLRDYLEKSGYKVSCLDNGSELDWNTSERTLQIEHSTTRYWLY